MVSLPHKGEVMGEFVICSQYIYWEECENKEDRDGCYFGEINKNEDFGQE